MEFSQKGVKSNGKRTFLPDINRLIQMGINPKTGLPIKLGTGERCNTKEGIKIALRVIDEQDSVNRYTWYNLPCNLTSQEIERMLYYKGQLCFFYDKNLDEFYFMPYALEGGLDWYGRYRVIHPIPWNAGGTTDKSIKAQEAYITSIKLDVKYGVVLPDMLKEEDLYKSAVILHDYTRQLNQQILPRVTINDPILDLEAECMPYMRTALLMGTGIRGVKVDDTDQEASVQEGSRNMTNAALRGEPYVPIAGNFVEFQEMTNGGVTKAEDYLIAMEAIDNFRLSTYGMDQGGLFNKKSYVNEAQTQMNANGAGVGAVLQDGLSIRQNFCNIVNSIWGLGIWCEPSETISQADTNGDGVLYDRNEGEKTGVAEESEVAENE